MICGQQLVFALQGTGSYLAAKPDRSPEVDLHLLTGLLIGRTLDNAVQTVACRVNNDVDSTEVIVHLFEESSRGVGRVADIKFDDESREVIPSK